MRFFGLINGYYHSVNVFENNFLFICQLQFTLHILMIEIYKVPTNKKKKVKNKQTTRHTLHQTIFSKISEHNFS